MIKNIFVIYVGVAMVRTEDIDTFVNKVVDKVIPTTFDGEIIVIPVHDVNTRIECINPKYITESEIIKQHSESMKKLQQELQHQTELLKQNNNG